MRMNRSLMALIQPEAAYFGTDRGTHTSYILDLVSEDPLVASVGAFIYPSPRGKPMLIRHRPPADPGGTRIPSMLSPKVGKSNEVASYPLAG